MNAVVMEGFANANAVGGAVRTELQEGIERVARVVPTVGSAFGAVVGPEAEHVQFVDDKGEFVPPDVMLACLIDRLRPRKVVLPINLSRQYARLVEDNGGTVEWSRTGLDNVAIKAAASRADLAGLADGRYIFPTFLPAPDCFMTARPRARGVPGRAPLEDAGQVRRALRQRRPREAGVPVVSQGARDARPRREVRRRPRRYPHRRRQAQCRWRLGTHAPRPGQPRILRLRRARHGQRNAPQRAHERLRRARPLAHRR